jgi:hypothetical protein
MFLLKLIPMKTKHFLSFFLSFFLIILNTSCEKQEFKEKEQIIPVNSLVNSHHILSESIKIKNGTLQFDENIFDVLKIISSMNEDELDTWEQSIGFVSLRTVINNICKEKMLYEDFNEMELVDEYPEIFTINNGNVEPIIFSSIDQAVRNPKGEYFFQNVLNVKINRGTLHILNPDEQNIDKLIKTRTFSEKNSILFLEDEYEIIEVNDKSCVQTNDEGNEYHYIEYKKGENNDGDRRGIHVFLC